MLLAVGLPIGVAGVCPAFFIQGAALAGLGLSWMNTLQEFVPADLLGRVASVIALGLLHPAIRVVD
jgi:MFS transporter, DHA3 family, tetracycline resistance protein